MRDNILNKWKSAIAKIMVTGMVFVSVMTISPITADAASTPTLTKAECDVLVGQQYDLNVNDKIAKASYEWCTSDKKIATVDKKGVVTGVSQGKTTITCDITTPAKDTYTLTCKVTIRKPAKLFMITNKITALNIGQKYNLNKRLIPSKSKDKTTWKSSDATIANPDSRGKFVALKEGTVTITGSAISGACDSVTIKVVDKDGTVKNQNELTALLGSGASVITIKTTDAVNLTIPCGDYRNQKLIVDAPKADITNYGVFASIEIKQIKADTWRENAVGNLLKILASDSRIVIGPNAKVSIDVSEKGATLTIVNNGVVEKLFISKEAVIAVSGDSKQEIPVVVNVPNIKITTSVPLNLDCKEKMELVLLAGAEKTKIQAETKEDIPVIKGDVKINVKVGTGDNVKEETVTGAPITEPTNNQDPGSTSPTSTTYILPDSYTKLKKIDVTYKGVTYTVTSTVLDTLKLFLSNESKTLDYWKSTTDVTNTYNGETVRVTGTKGSATKTVKFTGTGKLSGKTFTVTVNADHSVTVSSAKYTFTISKLDDKTLVIAPPPTGLSFNPTY